MLNWFDGFDQFVSVNRKRSVTVSSTGDSDRWQVGVASCRLGVVDIKVNICFDLNDFRRFVGRCLVSGCGQ